MKNEYKKYDRISLSLEQIDKLHGSSDKTVIEMLENISLPRIVVLTDNGAYYAFTSENGINIHQGNSFEEHFDFNVRFVNGRIGFEPTFLNHGFMTALTSEYSEEDFKLYLKELLGLYAILNEISLNRPTVLTMDEIQVEVPKTIKKNGKYKEVRSSVMVKRYQLNDKELPNRHNNITCPCWGVAGHYRHYKNGKVVFIASYRKGKKRNDPEAYSPKEYAIGG